MCDKVCHPLCLTFALIIKDLAECGAGVSPNDTLYNTKYFAAMSTKGV